LVNVGIFKLCICEILSSWPQNALMISNARFFRSRKDF
jgi:hypothetical protein